MMKYLSFVLINLITSITFIFPSFAQVSEDIEQQSSDFILESQEVKSPQILADYEEFTGNAETLLLPSESQINQAITETVTIESAENQEIIAQSPETQGNEAEENLAAESQNPIANLISVPFQNNTSFGVGEYDRTQNILNIQPVIPVPINEDWLIVTRTIVPIVYQPATSPANPSSHFGLGDINPQLFFVPKTKGNITWGLGPVFLLPTATDESLGTGKWGIGPTGVVVWSKDRWVAGAIVNNIWSVAGDGDRADVNQFLAQPFVNYNLDNGWYIVSGPIITANWEADAGNQWLVPLGGGMGKLFKIGEQPVNTSVQAFWNVVKPKNGPEWLLRFQFQLLFPQK